jgi:hypothetical protein
MMPVPSHLKGIAVPRDPVADQEPLTADIRCSCGESTMELLYPGQTHRHEHKTIPCTAEIDGNYFFVVRAGARAAQRVICCWMPIFMAGTDSCAMTRRKPPCPGRH